MNGWLVEQMNVHELPDERRDLVLAWLARHGVDVNDVRPTLTVSDQGGVLRIHLSRFWRVDGKKVADHNLGVIATVPLVVDINPTDPPPWLIKE